MRNRIILEAQSDQSVYPLPDYPDTDLVRVAYREWDAPTLSNGRRLEIDSFEAAPTCSYLHAINIGRPPETEQEARAFTRAMSHYLKHPVWFWFVPSNSLIVFPPPSCDGDMIVVEWEQSVNGPQSD